MPNKKEQKQKLRFFPYNLRKFASLSSIPETDSQISLEDSDNNLSQSSSNISDYSSKSIQDIMTTNNTELSMTQQVDIFNSLRIPDAIKDLPKFDGNPRLLNDFLNNVEEILLYIRGTDNTPYGKILLRAIRNKIEGQANEILNTYGTPLVWDDIKNNLILHYSDKRSETSLIRDLHNVKQQGKSIESFYREIIELQASLCNNILIHEKNTSVLNAKKTLYSEMCLNSFLSGLNEPLGSRIRAMQPDSIAAALSYCVKEQNIAYQRAPQTPRIVGQSQYKPYDARFRYANTNQNNNGQNRFPNARNNQPQPRQNYQNPFNRNSNQIPQNNAILPRIKASPSQQTRFAKSPNLNVNEVINHENFQQLDRFFNTDPNNAEYSTDPYQHEEYYNNADQDVHNSANPDGYRQSDVGYEDEPTNIDDTGNFFTTASTNQPAT